jgi:hypothetical protein
MHHHTSIAAANQCVQVLAELAHSVSMAHNNVDACTSLTKIVCHELQGKRGDRTRHTCSKLRSCSRTLQRATAAQNKQPAQPTANI